MHNGRKVETRRDRKALARDAGFSRVSALSVLAGAFCGLAAFEVLTALAAAAVVAIHGGTDFASWGSGPFKTLTGAILALGVFLAFVFGGYVSGRMSRRGVHGY